MSGRGRRHVLLLAMLLTLAACQAPAAKSQPKTANQRVQAADARLYAGDYDGAEASYRALAGDGVAGAASHLSTLLAYESRFEESVATARAGVQARTDSSR